MNFPFNQSFVNTKQKVTETDLEQSINCFFADWNDQNTINRKSNVGSSVELPCNVTHNHFVGWTVVNKESIVKIITIGNTTFSEHYSILFSSENNSTLSTSSYLMYRLLINNFTDDQEGLYTCHDQGCNKAKVVLFVECKYGFRIFTLIGLASNQNMFDVA